MKRQKRHHHQTDADRQEIAENKQLVPFHRHSDSVHRVGGHQLVTQTSNSAEKEREPRIGTRLHSERLEQCLISRIAIKHGAGPEPKQKHIEIAVVGVAHTVPHPRTVVVHLQNASDHGRERTDFEAVKWCHGQSENA